MLKLMQMGTTGRCPSWSSLALVGLVQPIYVIITTRNYISKLTSKMTQRPKFKFHHVGEEI
jgi:hypothetical protein